jgi:hypothetical protein
MRPSDELASNAGQTKFVSIRVHSRLNLFLRPSVGLLPARALSSALPQEFARRFRQAGWTDPVILEDLGLTAGHGVLIRDSNTFEFWR